MIWCGVKIKENCYALVNQFHGNFRSKILCCRKIKSVFRDVKWCFNASWGLKGLNRLNVADRDIGDAHLTLCVLITTTDILSQTFNLWLKKVEYWNWSWRRRQHLLEGTKLEKCSLTESVLKFVLHAAKNQFSDNFNYGWKISKWPV